jgi:hypothetical protein
MNERIKELWVQAAEKTQGDSWEEQTKFIERFAELIVEECGVALSPMLRDMVSRGQAFDLIKQHFGVN